MGKAQDAVQRFYELFATGDLDGAMTGFDPECVSRMPGGALSQAEHRAMGDAFKAGLPDARMVARHVVETGDEVVVIGNFRGTHAGDLVSAGGTIPASGKPLDLTFMDYFRVVGDRIVEHETVFDQLQLLGQLGAVPPA